MTTDGPSFYRLTELYPDEASAIGYFDKRRWPRGARCPRCKSKDVFKGHAKRRLPLWHCRKCKRQFTVTSGTVMQSTHLPLRKWLFAFHMLGGAKKSISARQLARNLGVTLKTSWHLGHRIRATMTDNSQFFSGGIVETDEAYIGGRRRGMGRGYRGNKIAVQTIVQRHGKKTGRHRKRLYGEPVVENPGRVQTIALDPEAENVDGRTVGAKLRAHTDPATTRLMTDESPIYDKVGESFKSHETVTHAKREYVRTEPLTGRVVTTNTAEGVFANLKRQITGTHHSTSKKHLPRYLEEYDYKYNTRDQSDTERTEAAIDNAEGKRVTLFKSATGTGDSLIDTKAGEKRKHGTMRGMHSKRRRDRRRRQQS
jgi:transposase-like protein